MNIFNKIRWVAGVLLVFAIVLTTNLIDKDNFRKLRDSVVTIYEDRVVASDLIFEMTILVQEKEVAFAISDTSFFQSKNEKANQEILELMASFEQTELTRKEQQIFNSLKEELKRLVSLEKEYINASREDTKPLFESIDQIVHQLYNLSKVQLEEGKRQMKRSNKTMETIDLFTKLEIIFLILLAVIAQILILYKSK